MYPTLVFAPALLSPAAFVPPLFFASVRVNNGLQVNQNCVKADFANAVERNKNVVATLKNVKAPLKTGNNNSQNFAAALVKN